MVQPLRIQYPGAWYHLTGRGIERRPLFRDERDRQQLVELLEEAVERLLRLCAYILMDNHYHLLLQIREANLSAAMQWLGDSYAMWFNRRHLLGRAVVPGPVPKGCWWAGKSMRPRSAATFISIPCEPSCTVWASATRRRVGRAFWRHRRIRVRLRRVSACGSRGARGELVSGVRGTGADARRAGRAHDSGDGGRASGGRGTGVGPTSVMWRRRCGKGYRRLPGSGWSVGSCSAGRPSCARRGAGCGQRARATGGLPSG